MKFESSRSEFACTPKINIEPEHDGLDDDFSSSRGVVSGSRLIGIIQLLVSTHVKNMLVKMGSCSPRFGVKNDKNWNQHLAICFLKLLKIGIYFWKIPLQPLPFPG